MFLKLYVNKRISMPKESINRAVEASISSVMRYKLLIGTAINIFENVDIVQKMCHLIPLSSAISNLA